MNKLYIQNAKILKALADPNRLMIIDMLSSGELCACKILEKFQITQSTLSHHMKALRDCELVSGRKEGKWMYYTLNLQTINSFNIFISNLASENEDCICHVDQKVI